MNLVKKIIAIIVILILILLVHTNISKAATVEITTETLNLRKEPSTEADIVAQISIGDECELLGEDGDWYQVQYGEYTGYISKEYAEVVGEDDNTVTGNNGSDNNETTGNKNNTTEVNTSNNENNTQSNSNGEAVNSEDNTLNEDKANEPDNTDTNNQSNDSETAKNVTSKTTAKVSIRITPLINSSIIDTVAKNTEVLVINQINGWAYIQTDEVSGWVRSNSLKIDNNTDMNGKDNAQTNQPNSKDETDGSSNETNNEGSDSNASEGNDPSDFKQRVMYTEDIVNIRKEPTTTAEIIMVVEQNTELTVIGETGDWYEVETSQGNAYVSKSALSETRVSVTNRGNVDRTNNNANDSTNNNTNDKKSEAEGESSSTSNSSTIKAEEIVSYAKKFLGVPYVYGGASPSGFDCSGFTMYVFDHFGISMRHGAQAQAKLGEKVSADKSSKSSLLNNLEVGDLVFFLDYETMDEIGHCGIYIGDGNFIHASSGSGYCVKINSLLPGEYYNTRYCAARRVW